MNPTLPRDFPVEAQPRSGEIVKHVAVAGESAQVVLVQHASHVRMLTLKLDRTVVEYWQGEQLVSGIRESWTVTETLTTSLAAAPEQPPAALHVEQRFHFDGRRPTIEHPMLQHAACQSALFIDVLRDCDPLAAVAWYSGTTPDDAFVVSTPAPRKD